MNRKGTAEMQGSEALGKGRKVWFIPAIAIVFAAGLAAEAKAADRLPELMKSAGIDRAFDHMGDALKTGVKQALPQSPMSTAAKEKVLAAVEPAADAAFGPATLKREFLLALAGKLSNADIDGIIAFNKSPLGARMTAMENASHGTAASGQLAKMAGELMELLKKDPERAEVLTHMDSSLRLSESGTDIAFNMGRATAIGMAAADERTVALSPEAIGAIDSALEKMRPSLAAAMKQQMLLVLAYTYREASIPELRQYLVFLTSPVGKRYYGATVPAMNEVLVKAGGEFGHALMRELGKERT
jgi:hypothetical protein